MGLRQAGIPLSQKSETFLKVFPQGEDVSEGLGHKTQAQHNNEKKYLFFFFLHSILFVLSKHIECTVDCSVIFTTIGKSDKKVVANVLLGENTR